LRALLVRGDRRRKSSLRQRPKEHKQPKRSRCVRPKFDRPGEDRDPYHRPWFGEGLSLFLPVPPRHNFCWRIMGPRPWRRDEQKPDVRVVHLPLLIAHHFKIKETQDNAWPAREERFLWSCAKNQLRVKRISSACPPAHPNAERRRTSTPMAKRRRGSSSRPTLQSPICGPSAMFPFYTKTGRYNAVPHGLALDGWPLVRVGEAPHRPQAIIFKKNIRRAQRAGLQDPTMAPTLRW